MTGEGLVFNPVATMFDTGVQNCVCFVLMRTPDESFSSVDRK